MHSPGHVLPCRWCGQTPKPEPCPYGGWEIICDCYDGEPGYVRDADRQAAIDYWNDYESVGGC